MGGGGFGEGLGRLRTLLEGFLAPLRAAVSPTRFYDRLSVLVDRYSLYASALIYLGAWLWASTASFMLTMVVLAVRGVLGLDPAAVLLAPFKALVLAVATPVLAALVDASLIALVALPAPRRRPLYVVFLVRASSLLPYTLRAPLVAALGGGPLSLVASPLHPLDLALLALGALLTARGLQRALGMPPGSSLAAAFLPALLKVALGVAV